MTVQVGDILGGKYRLERLRGKGGMGAVYEARHVVLGKSFAIKLLHPHYAMQPEVFKRFQLEAQAAAAIGHRGIVDVYDIGRTDEGAPFLVMELLKGESLAELLDRRKRLEVSVAVEVVSQTLSALVAVHKKKILHRDLKPENLFLCQEEDEEEGGIWSVKILDFGISKVTGTDAMHLTMTGSVLGTAHFMSPEQARGAKDVDLRADLWAMGAILYRALSGVLPFEGDSYNEVLAKILSDPVVSPRTKRPEIPETLELIVLQALAKDREERYRSASDFLEDLEAFRVPREEVPWPWNGPLPVDEEDVKETMGPAEVRPASDHLVDLEDSKPTAAFDAESLDGLAPPLLEGSKQTMPRPLDFQDSKETTPLLLDFQDSQQTAAFALELRDSQGAMPETCMIPTEHWRDPKPPWEKSPPHRPDTFDATERIARQLSDRQRLVMVSLLVLAVGAAAGIGWATWSLHEDAERNERSEPFGIVVNQPPSSNQTPEPVELDGPSAEQPSGQDVAASTAEPSSGDSGSEHALVPPRSSESSSGETTESRAELPPSRPSPPRLRPLNQQEIAAGLQSSEPRLQRCLASSRTAPDVVRVRVRISGAGAVSYESAVPSPPLSVSSCFREAVRGARIGSGGTEPTTHIIAIRRPSRRPPSRQNSPLWDSPF